MLESIVPTKIEKPIQLFCLKALRHLSGSSFLTRRNCIKTSPRQTTILQ